jgi:hypothetical protein
VKREMMIGKGRKGKKERETRKGRGGERSEKEIRREMRMRKEI